MHGGGHERGMRSGTLPTHQIVGMGEAYRIAREEMKEEIARVKGLIKRLADGLSQIEAVVFNGDMEHRIPYQPQRQFQLRRRRIDDDGNERPGCFFRLCLYFRQP